MAAGCMHGIGVLLPLAPAGTGAGMGWGPWSAWIDAFGYFRELKPFAQVGHSIYLYRVTQEDCDRLSRYWSESAEVLRR